MGFLSRIFKKSEPEKEKSAFEEPSAVRIGDPIARCIELYGEPISKFDDGALLFHTSSLLHGSCASVTCLEDGTVDSILYAVPPGECVSRKAALRLMEISTQNLAGKWESGGNLFGSETFYHPEGLEAKIDDSSLHIGPEF
tara:strand:+ start:1666 stop:2088 length:423 start_codon:yes stop_codon:yes gene_type:complete